MSEADRAERLRQLAGLVEKAVTFEDLKVCLKDLVNQMSHEIDHSLEDYEYLFKSGDDAS